MPFLCLEELGDGRLQIADARSCGAVFAQDAFDAELMAVCGQPYVFVYEVKSATEVYSYPKYRLSSLNFLLSKKTIQKMPIILNFVLLAEFYLH